MPLSQELFNVYFYVPQNHAPAVKEAVFAAGAGRIGQYDSCAWEVEGQGQFRPCAGAQPFSGTLGQVSHDKELRVEFVCPKDLLEPVLQALVQAHPYEEPAYGAHPIATLARGAGPLGAPVPVNTGSFTASPAAGADMKDLEIYRHALLYQELHADFVQDCDFYRRLLKDCTGPILELGAGNARVGRALALDGHEVWALDLVDEIMELGVAMARQEGTVLHTCKGDMRNFTILDAQGQPVRFAAVICPLNTLSHLLEYREFWSCLASVRRHLLPGGIFVPSLFVPDPAFLYRDPEALRLVDRFHSPSWGTDVELYEQNSFHPLSQINTLTWIFQPDAEEEEPVIETYRLRVYHPQEIRGLAEAAGFIQSEVWLDYETPGDPEKPETLNSQTIMQTLVFKTTATA